jgi:hypothetical protein
LPSLDEKIKEYGQKPGGKAVLVAVPVIILVGLLAFAFLTLVKSNEPPSEVTKVTESAPPASQESPATKTDDDGDQGEPPINQDYEVYETRDPFKPADTGESSPEARRTTGPSTNPRVDPQPTAQVLSLQSTEDQDGVWYANVKLGSATHTVRAGDRVGDSSFQVVSVSSENATFLYGDDRLTLAVGQEVNK